MNSNFDDLPFDNDFYQTYNFSSDDNLYYNNMTHTDAFDDAYMIAGSLMNIERIMALCGVLLSVVFAGLLICVMFSNRGKQAVMPRLWLTFGMVIAHTIVLVILPLQGMILTIAMQTSNTPLCIFISSISYCCDFVSTLTATVLSCNVYCSLRSPRNAATRKATLVWICAGFSAWIVGFGICLAIQIAATAASEGHCGGNFAPLYLEIIRFIATFVAPYTISIVLTGLTIYRWRNMGYEEVTQFQLSERSGVGQVLKLPAHVTIETSTPNMPGIVDTSSPLQENTENMGIEGAYKGAEPRNTVINVPSTSTAMEADAKPVHERTSPADEGQRGKTSLKFWVIFNAVNVFMSFVCRLCISLPKENLLMNWEWQVMYYMSVHMLLVFYYVCYPILCLITVEVRNVRKTCRKCIVCYKICCWCCNCCLETDDGE